MIYSLSLASAFALVGALLLALGLLALARREMVQGWLRTFPRSRTWGYALLAIVTAWSWWLIRTIDLGEFDNWRIRVLIAIPVAAILTARYVDELLAVRSLGMLILLVAEPLLEAAFLQPELSRLLLVSLVYIAIIFGMFWIGMPYLMRDQIQWFISSERRWYAGAVVSIAYGTVLLIRCLTLHRSS